MSEEVLKRVETKLNALLAITLDRYLRDTEIARPKQRSIDRMLSDVGVPTSDIAKLLGKTDRAVQLQLQREAKRKKPKAGQSNGDGDES